MGDLFDSTVQLEEQFIQEGVSEGLKYGLLASAEHFLPASIGTYINYLRVYCYHTGLGGEAACWKGSNLECIRDLRWDRRLASTGAVSRQEDLHL